MNKEDILKMAREASQGEPISAYLFNDLTARAWSSFLDRFAALVSAKAAQDERAICAALCESHEWADGHPLARKIRDRGQ